MLQLPNFSAWISSGEDVLPEYGVHTSRTQGRAVCHIPILPGAVSSHTATCVYPLAHMPLPVSKPFIIHWRQHDTHAQTCSYLDIDGTTIPGKFLTGEDEAFRSGVRTGSTTERPFLFPQLTKPGASFAASRHENVLSCTWQLAQTTTLTPLTNCWVPSY
jgi:hypothetical protein